MMWSPIPGTTDKTYLTKDDIISSLGEFDQEQNILKKYARRG